MSDATNLPLRAENNPKFYSRFKWLGLGAFAFMLYCLYDGLYNYPLIEKRGVALMELADETLPQDVIDEIHAKTHRPHDRYQMVRSLVSKSEELKAAWIERAQLEGWSVGLPKKFKDQSDVPAQHGMAVISLLTALWFWFTVYRTGGRWFQLGTEGITSRWGESFSLDQVTQIDKKLWRDKGIAYVKYQGDGGKSRTFVVDNYKYDKETTDQIMLEIERGAGLDKITNGPPEVDPNAPEPVVAPEAREQSQSEQTTEA